MSVKRWTAYIEDDDGNDFHAAFEADSNGLWVTYDDHAAKVEALQARAAQLTEAGLADQARADAWRDRFQAQKRIAKKLLARVAELEAAIRDLKAVDDTAYFDGVAWETKLRDLYALAAVDAEGEQP